MLLIKAKALKGYHLECLDGKIGRVEEFYFDDHHWTIRYLVADTGSWLPGRQVLISPYALGHVVEEEKIITVSLTEKQIENSPSIHSDQPVSRQFETDYYEYYGWPMYWVGPYMWGYYPYMERNPEKWQDYKKDEDVWDPHLRSTQEVSDYHVQAKDGEIGHIEDFIIDDETWAIRYLIIDTRNWWPGKKVLLSPKWIDRISWEEAKVFVNLERETIRQSPEYKDDSQITRDYETGLHRHYNRNGYWIEEPATKRHFQ
jgi:hypothetical protein